jgi:hypothetical protein
MRHLDGLIDPFKRNDTIVQVINLALRVIERSLDGYEFLTGIFSQQMVKEV